MLPKTSRTAKRSYGRRKKSSKDIQPHLNWTFKPKLENEAVVLHSILDIYTIDNYRVIVDDMRNLITKLVQNHGFNDGADRYKIIQNYTIQLIEGRNPENPEWLATSEKYKVPSQLGKTFCQLIADYCQVTDPVLRAKYYQVIITTLNIIRMVEGLVDADIKTITDKASQIDQVILDEFSDFVAKQLEKYRYKTEDIFNLFDIRFNIKKKGPNGVPKLESAIPEAHALLSSNLNRPFKIVCQELNLNYLYDYLLLLTSSKAGSLTNTTNNVQSENSETKLRVLANVPDRGFKTRVVAIVDFWSQLVLEPFRSHVQFVIEKVFGNADYRLNQDEGVAHMTDFQQRCLDKEIVTFRGKTLELDAKHLKFYDIKSWTDRLHRDLQKITVKHLVSKRFAESWAQLVVHCPWFHTKSGRILKYGQGQGMGTNGSFDVATLTDHLLIKWIDSIYYDGLIHHIGGYGKVGDDLWIYDPENRIPELYEKINLPINFSKSKSFCAIGSVSEFCARTFLNCTDVSRISPNIISKSKNFRYIPLLLGICSSRGIQLDATSFPSLNRKVKGTEISYITKLQDFLVAYLLIGQTEPSPVWKSLTLEYLEAGNWIEGDLIYKFLNDPEFLSRLLVGYSIVTLAENSKVAMDKLFENVDVMGEYGDGITQICTSESNLFDTESQYYLDTVEMVEEDVLTPKKVILLGRYKDQRRLIHDDLLEIHEKLNLDDYPRAIFEYATEVAEIANRSCYDRGNLNYSSEEVQSTQLRIIKVLSNMNEDFTTLRYSSNSMFESLLQLIQYDETSRKWKNHLPVLLAD